MAGKTKQTVNSPYQARPTSGKGSNSSSQQRIMPVPMKGHMGLKSSPFSPVSAKLTSQYMVLDHMAAHYRKIANAKSAIDMKQPKAWSTSQKVRDQAKREAFKHDAKKRAGVSPSPRHTARDSDVDRFELYDMMESLNEDGAVNTTLEVHPSDNMSLTRQDDKLVEHLVKNSRQSPHKSPIRSNYVETTTMTRSGYPTSGYMASNSVTGGINSARTPRQESADLLNKQSHKFTEEKAFTPRTLKTHKNVQSRLSSLKCYRPPPKKQSTSGPVKSSGPVMTRPETPMTADSVDLMNETLMSRDLSKGSARTPTGVPPLDISMDADHIHWLKEQSKKARVRAKHEPVESGSMSHVNRVNGEQHYKGQMVGAKTQTLNQILTEEEELKYLEFVQDVTNDILETGVFTNRVLKKVFQKHIDRRKHELKVSRMRELMEELRADLCIPADDSQDYENAGYSSTTYNDNLGASMEYTGHNDYQVDMGLTESQHKSLQKSLKTIPGDNSSLGKPPLPKPRSRGTGRNAGLQGYSVDESLTEESPDKSLRYSDDFDEEDETITLENNKSEYFKKDSDENRIVPKPSPRKVDKHSLSPRVATNNSEIEEDKELSSIQVSELEDENDLDDF